MDVWMGWERPPYGCVGLWEGASLWVGVHNYPIATLCVNG